MSLKIEVGVIKIEGQEACKFLHAIVSSDVESLNVGESQSSLLLTPSGKVVSTFWIYRNDDDSFILVMEKAIVQKTISNLSRFLIRTKAVIEDVSTEYFAVIGQKDEITSEPGMLLEENHLGVEGLWLRLMQRSVEMSFDANEQVAYENLRISYGAVSCSRDLLNDIIPQEAHLDVKAVSFSKGCYLGQELVCRIDSREASTPFSFFATNNSQATTDGNFVVTSKLEPDESFENGLEQGPFTSIIRVPRKYMKDIEDAGAQPVNGYFTT